MSKLWVQLGRSGDIMNVLPLLWQEAQAGRKCRLMVAKEYAPLLEGVSYVDPIVFDGQAHELDRALTQARILADNEVICTQVNGPLELVEELVYKPAGQTRAVTTSYQKEMWKIAGKLADWGNYPEHPCGQLPLVFDKPSLDREGALLEKAFAGRKNKKVILLAADGLSSPFPYKKLLLYLLKECSRFHVVDLGEVKAHRLFDLLALYRSAHALVAVDSAPLHLANAVPNLPVFALVNDRPLLWNGSSWRANHAFYCRYADFPNRAPAMMTLLEEFKRIEPGEQTTVHVYNGLKESAPMTPPDRFWQLLPIEPGMMGRLTEDGQPYLKDCLKMAIQRAGQNGKVVLSRPGLDLSRNISIELSLLQKPGYAYRLSKGQYSPITDFFVAPAPWWADRLKEIPDLFLNNDYFWSTAIGTIFQAHNAKDITGICERIPTRPVKAAKGPQQQIPPSTAANIKAKDELNARLKPTGRYPAITKQLPTVMPDASLLPLRPYNPSIGTFNGRTVMTYRYHFANDTRTRLGLATLTKDYRLENPQDLPINGISREDARLFKFHGETWISWVESDWVGQRDPHCVVKYAQLEHGPKIGRVHQVKVGSNDGNHREKNWVFFEYNECLFCIYRAEPDYTVMQIQGEAIVNEYKTPALRWPYGEIRGGCVVPSGDHWLRFFHSHTNEGIGEPEVRYFMGACLMERHWPFKVIASSRKPILYGSEEPNSVIYPYKGGVVFPGGAIGPTPDASYLVAIGINDCACGLVKVAPENLNLVPIK